MDNLEGEALEEELRKQLATVDELKAKSMYVTATRVALEVKRQAKAHHLLSPFLHANFDLLNSASSTFETEQGIDCGLQMIGLLESPEKAAAFQSDYSEGEYEYLQWMLLPCYHLYASLTGTLKGNNSEGLQRCIAEGEEVCRRTGTGFVTSFREFASDVFLAADDPEMALHHARVVAKTLLHNGHDRRWVGARDETKILMAMGQLTAALDASAGMIERAREWHSPLGAMQDSLGFTQTILHLLGRPGDLASLVPDAEEWLSQRPPAAEDPEGELNKAQVTAVGLACEGKTREAIDVLAHWDRLLLTRKVMDRWFDVRCCLVATQMLAGNRAPAEKLAAQVIEKARAARDFRTIRRIKLMLDGAIRICPTAPLAECDAGLFASKPMAAAGGAAATPAASGASPSSSPAAGATNAEEATPLKGFLDAQIESLQAGEEHHPNVARELVKSAPPAHPLDAAGLLHLMGYVLEHLPEGDVWAWAQSIIAPHKRNGRVLAVFADIASALRDKEDSTLAEQITVDQIESMHRTAMDLEPDRTGVFARAGFFFLRERNLGEAERCLARASRLDRADERVAMTLADIYASTDRPTDALHVLDLCIREGTQSPDLFGKAAMQAHGLRQWTAALTYFDALESLAPNQPWTQYYRALELFELKRYDECLLAVDAESKQEESSAIALASIRAAALHEMGRHDESRPQLELIAGHPLKDAGPLTPQGIAAIFSRCWPAVAALPESDPLRRAFTAKALAAGMTPDDYFTALRSKREQAKVNHYACMIRQPLGDDWKDHAGCLAGQEEWIGYLQRFGVLAGSEEEAAEQVLALQGTIGHREEAAIVETLMDGEGFEDNPGITWQGPRAELVEEDAEASDE